MLEIFKRELRYELPKEGDKKRMLAFIGLAILAYILFKDNLARNKISMLAIATGISLISFYTAGLFMLSKLNGRYIKLWFSLPISRQSYMGITIVISYIKYYVLRSLPFVLAMLFIWNEKRYMNFTKAVVILLLISANALIFTFLGGMGAMLLNKITWSKRKRKEKSRGHCIRSVSINLVIREWQSFRKDRLILINHTAYGAFVLFFIYNTCMALKNAALFAMSLMFLSSTAAVSYSKDKSVIKLTRILPVKTYKVFMAKYVFNLSVSMPFYAFGIVIMSTFTKILLRELVIYTIISSLLTTFVKLYADYIAPVYDWQHVKQILEHKRKYGIWAMVLAAAFPSVFIGSINICFIAVLQIAISALSIIVYSSSTRSRGRYYDII